MCHLINIQQEGNENGNIIREEEEGTIDGNDDVIYIPAVKEIIQCLIDTCQVTYVCILYIFAIRILYACLNLCTYIHYIYI